MRRAALLLSLLTAACPTGRLEGGRYACDPKGDRSANSEQCPGFWRCGLEGFCHPFGDTGTKWRCETAADCEASWQCGLAPSRALRECHDPGLGAAWPCDSAADCSAGWECGLDRAGDAGECHDPAAPAGFTCASDSHCLGGWRCGQTRSGAGRECHDPARPSDWPCDGDGDCVGGWRCNSGGACADPRLDALLPTQALDAGVTRVSPLSALPYDAVSVSPPLIGADGRTRQLLTRLRAGQLEMLVIDTETRAVKTWRTSDPGFQRFIAHGMQTLTDVGVATVPDARPRVVGVFADGGLLTLTLEADGGVTTEDFIDYFGRLPEFEVTRFKHSSGGRADFPAPVLSFDPDVTSRFGRIWGPAEWAQSSYYVDFFNYEFTAVPGNLVRDLVEIRPDAWECLFAAEARGLWVAQRSPSFGFEPLDSASLPNRVCQPGAAPPAINRLAAFGDGWLALEQTPDGGASLLTLLDVRQLTKRTSATDPDLHCTSYLGAACSAFDKLPFVIELGPCAPCIGSELAEFTVVANGAGPPELEARCSLGDGGSSAFYRLAHRSPGSPSCDRRLLVGASALFAARGLEAPAERVPGTVSWWSPGGQLWLGPDTNAAAPLVFDRAANGVLSRGGPGEVVAIAEDMVGFPEAGLGLSAVPFAGMQTPVRHRPSWALRSGTVIDVAGSAPLPEATVAAILATPMASPTGPFAAALVRSQTGRALVVATGSQLWAAEADRFLSGSEPYMVLAPRLALLNTVQSLALPEQPAPGASWLEGYVVLGGRVQRLVAESATRWRSEDVPLPASRVPEEVWFDRDRARVGLTDGSVLGLPSRVPLAAKLPLGAVDFEQTCGEQLALSADGLYRLTARVGESQGRWAPLPLPPGFGALEGGRVHALGAEVYVFTRTGEVARVTLGGATCP